MARIESVQYQDQVVRLVMLDERWWVFAEDVEGQLDARLPSSIFDSAPEGERMLAFLGDKPPVKLLSARHLTRSLLPLATRDMAAQAARKTGSACATDSSSSSPGSLSFPRLPFCEPC